MKQLYLILFAMLLPLAATSQTENRQSIEASETSAPPVAEKDSV